MTTHKCLHEEKITDLKNDMYGNGQKGVKMDVTILKTKFKFVLIGLGFMIVEITAILVFILKLK